MKIYIAHAKAYDYINELYKPIRESELSKEHEIILPHELDDKSSTSREFYRSLDLFIGEVSYSATGLGIELGWAYDDEIPLYCIHKEETRIKGSIYAITNNIYEYTDETLVDTINHIIKLEKEKNKARTR
jgi:hypothetical protein